MQNNKHLDWVKNSIFYQIFPDRFAKSEKVIKPTNIETWYSRPTELGFKGGDLLGICEHLDYLEDLGVNAIYLNPIFQSTMNHRYGISDYYRIDPLLGSNQTFKYLIKTAKKRGFKIILDGVFNHTGRSFFQFQSILDSEFDSPFIDWYYIKWFPVNAYNFEKELNYRAFYDRRGLPKLNLENPTVAEYIYKVAEFWTKQGIDGWRLDAPGEVEGKSFWQQFRKRIKAVNRDAYLVGEIWDDGAEWLKGDIFDGTTNYALLRACLGFFGKGNINFDLAGIIGGVRELSASDFSHEINRILELYSINDNLQLNFLSNHDIARYISVCNNDINSVKLSILFQMTFPGIPIIYYGDEVGMEGGSEPDCRRAFSWDHTDWNHEILDYYKKCIQLRKQYQAIREGKYIAIESENNVFLFCRSHSHEHLLMLFNTNNDTKTVELNLKKLNLDSLQSNMALTCIMGEYKNIENSESSIRISLLPKSTAVFLIS